jgi:mutator protein MutT
MGGNLIRYCVRCGAGDIERIGLKKLRCAKCKFELYLNSAAAVAAIINDDKGRLLVTVRRHDPAKGTMDLPGGFVDPEESAENAVRREVREEVGLEVQTMRYLYSLPNIYEFEGVKYATTDLVFRCQVNDTSKARVSDCEDVESFKWIEREQLDPEKFGLQSTCKIVSRYVSEECEHRG